LAWADAGSGVGAGIALAWADAADAGAGAFAWVGAGFGFAAGAVAGGAFAVALGFLAGVSFSRDPTGLGAAVDPWVPVVPSAVELGGTLPSGDSGWGEAALPYQPLAQGSQAQHTAPAGTEGSVNAVAAKGTVSRRDFVFIDLPPSYLHRAQVAVV
jgi:hypothetical protein